MCTDLIASLVFLIPLVALDAYLIAKLVREQGL